ncbi:hypothetical protein BJ508DRAFT_360344 [Ascobolus immersus RN42]|uniref:Uncharacterized protein n=1 Tax=Ascobolus immersus RN42 TaxID=1160509 RepID=A0A3N4IG51_ASCIM|nr:hypothetical protein BJ508DRAFT_360344 [Ascobolus immersus RN42]
MGKSDKKDKKDKKGGPRPMGPVTNDPRFATIHSDPRFALPKKKDAKVTIDKRFKSMLTDEDFARAAKVDRYGRKVERAAGREEIERFYHMESDDDDDADSEEDPKKDKKGKKKSEKKDKGDKKGKKEVEVEESESEEEAEESEDEEEGSDVEEIARPAFDAARGEGFASSSDDSEEDDYEVEEDAIQAEDIPIGDHTRRFAVVNMDWDNVRAVDLMAAFHSFKPANGKVNSVTIYPSEFGKERMEREELEGPPKEIFRSSREEQFDSDEEINEKTIIKEDKGEEFDSSKLRKYQLERLRYYYAVVECDSVETAKTIYEQCDGAEYEATANYFDLRFIPDDTTFDDDEPTDVCDAMPDSYRPNEFVTGALQHSKVKLTWDADDQRRQQVAKKAFSQKEIEENDLKAYLASSSDEEEDNEEARIRLRKLLGLDTDAPTSGESKTTGAGADGALEVSFTPADSKNSSKSKEEKDPENETTLEKYMRKEKEKKEARRKARKAKNGDEEHSASSESEEEEAAAATDDDLGFNDPFFEDPSVTKSKDSKKAEKAAKKEKKMAEAAEKASKKAELELLMASDDEGADSTKVKAHFDMKSVMKAEKTQKLKGKAKKKAAAKLAQHNDKVQDNFKMDVNDPRFSAVFESHEFAIDPTNPRFMKTEGMKAIMEEKRKRRRKGGDDDPEGEEKPDKKKKKKTEEKSKKDDVGSLVERIKRKSGKA